MLSAHMYNFVTGGDFWDNLYLGYGGTTVSGTVYVDDIRAE